ncbi:nudix hydrolase 18, mitochondrial-like [Apium graveolens]|uniref:nudix hydrolase 18, mitochondrial-like n=1 Tax=Apium graveolens TaxID=4045 RepID=UPI003D7BB17D
MVCLVSRTGRHLQKYNKGRRLVVGCIPYRYKNGKDGSMLIEDDDDEWEVLVVSSQKSPKMMFPKGGWELDESVEEAASRESLEEAGVLGNVQNKLGTWCYKSKSSEIYHEGYMFPLLVTEQLELWPEKNLRQRVWMSVDEAKEACEHCWWMKEALEILVDRLITLRKQEGEDE